MSIESTVSAGIDNTETVLSRERRRVNEIFAKPAPLPARPLGAVDTLVRHVKHDAAYGGYALTHKVVGLGDYVFGDGLRPAERGASEQACHGVWRPLVEKTCDLSNTCVKELGGMIGVLVGTALWAGHAGLVTVRDLSTANVRTTTSWTNAGQARGRDGTAAVSGRVLGAFRWLLTEPPAAILTLARWVAGPVGVVLGAAVGAVRGLGSAATVPFRRGDAPVADAGHDAGHSAEHAAAAAKRTAKRAKHTGEDAGKEAVHAAEDAGSKVKHLAEEAGSEVKHAAERTGATIREELNRAA